MKSITYEGTNFNADHLAKKTEDEFIAEFQNTPVYKNYSPEDKIRLLKAAYAKCREAVGIVDQPSVAAPAAAPAERSGRVAKEKPAEEK